jgi:hypothetical protein
MTDQSPVDVAGLLANLLQQQTALLLAHSESIRLQRLLVEQLLGTSSVADVAGAAPQPVPWEPRVAINASPTVSAPPAPPVAAQPVPSVPPESSTPLASEPVSEPPLAPATEPAGSTPRPAGSEVGLGENAAYAARYYRARAAPILVPVQPQDLELMRRLHEMGDASGLILNFGPHKGDTLAQVAMHDPDYVRQLVNRAQRPEVRAAAGRLVEAIDAAAEHKKRASRLSSRRSRPSS